MAPGRESSASVDSGLSFANSNYELLPDDVSRDSRREDCQGIKP